jgi:prespore-specific regulator
MEIKYSTDAREEFYLQTVEKWVARSDAWTPDDDERLASIVLNHIRTGSTQLRAFDDAANELGRTAAACGYRWNGVLRKDRKTNIESAKHERKSAQKSSPSVPSGAELEATPTAMTSSDSMKEVIHFLQSYDEQYQRLRKQVEGLEIERQHLQNQIRDLENHTTPPTPAKGPITPQQLVEDSKTLFAIMERARKLLETDSSKGHD